MQIALEFKDRIESEFMTQKRIKLAHADISDLENIAVIPGQAKLYLIDIATAPESPMRYSLLPVQSRESIVEDLKDWYESNDGRPQCDGVISLVPDSEFMAERFLIAVKDFKIIQQELLVMESNHKVTYYCAQIQPVKDETPATQRANS